MAVTKSISESIVDFVVRWIVALILGSAIVTGIVGAIEGFPVFTIIMGTLVAGAAVSLVRAGLVSDRDRRERQNDPRITIGETIWEAAQYMAPAQPDGPVHRLVVHLTVSSVGLPVSVSACRLHTARGVLDCAIRREPTPPDKSPWALTIGSTQIYNVHPDILRLPARLEPFETIVGYVYFMDRTDFPTPREIAATGGATLTIVANGLEWGFDITPVLS